MCGRLNIVDDPLAQLVSDFLGIDFKTTTNTNLCPSETLATIIRPTNGFEQINANWGIQPNWSKQLLINAQAETAHEKPSFKDAIVHSRCLVPVSGWYEWKTEGKKKIKYGFSHKRNEPFYMGGILYDIQAPKLVTLTRSPTPQCADIHNRMPVLIDQDKISYWFNASPNQLSTLYTVQNIQDIEITRLG